jgi:hypothetical protein
VTVASCARQGRPTSSATPACRTASPRSYQPPPAGPVEAAGVAGGQRACGPRRALVNGRADAMAAMPGGPAAEGRWSPAGRAGSSLGYSGRSQRAANHASELRRRRQVSPRGRTRWVRPKRGVTAAQALSMTKIVTYRGQRWPRSGRWWCSLRPVGGGGRSAVAVPWIRAAACVASRRRPANCAGYGPACDAGNRPGPLFGLGNGHIQLTSRWRRDECWRADAPGRSPVAPGAVSPESTGSGSLV